MTHPVSLFPEKIMSGSTLSVHFFFKRELSFFPSPGKGLTSMKIEYQSYTKRLLQSKQILTYMSRPDETRESLLNAALDIFSEKGFNGATTRSIAERAGVNEVTLFRHFGNKDSLFDAVIERDLNIKDQYMSVKVDPGDDPVELITEISLLMHSVMTERSRISRMIMQDGNRVGSDHMKRIGPTQGIAMLSKLFKEMGAEDPEMCAITMGSFILRSVLFSAFLGEDPVTTIDRDTVRRMALLLVNGMRGGL